MTNLQVFLQRPEEYVQLVSEAWCHLLDGMEAVFSVRLGVSTDQTDGLLIVHTVQPQLLRVLPAHRLDAGLHKTITQVSQGQV